ncbi:hypothetical protein GJ496_001313 [Pomphorhynchus laevis]|nr:hypothetical protein GJ496_001313 [Pomphorhynchus laevis]
MQSADLEAKKQRRLLVLAWGKLARAGVSLRKYRHQWVFQAHENYMSYLQMDVLCTAKCTSEQLPDHRAIITNRLLLAAIVLRKRSVYNLDVVDMW